MAKGVYNCIGIHQAFKLHGFQSSGFESFRRTLVVFIMATVSVLTSLAQTPLNETDVYNRLMERQHMAGYTEGTPWTNDIPYRRDDPYYNHVEFDGWPSGCYGGVGCFGFMMDMMEYASNYEYPIRLIYGTYDNLPEIRVGDGIRLDNNGHSVVVLEVHPDGHTVTVAEGNFNSTVHWGRIIDLADPNNGFYYLATFWPEQEPDLTITIGQSGYATFYYTNSSYVIPEGVEAKVVENISNNILTLIPLSRIIPAGCAVILEGPAGEYTFASTTEEGIAGENMLRGTEDTEWITPEDQTCKYYKLTVKNGKAGFYYGANDGAIFENQAHRAYLPVPVSQTNGAKGFFFNEATGIDNMLATDENAGHAVYNLSGQLVNDSYKGVVIINGKKVLRK